MSWSKPIAPGFISTYNAKMQSLAGSAAESLGMWLIEQLTEKYPQHRDQGGLITMNYQWIFDLNPQTQLKLPAVAIGISTMDFPKLGSYLHIGDGAMVPGQLKNAEILIVILANNSKLRDGIEDRISRWLSKIVNNSRSSPLRFLNRYDPGDDRGFTQGDRYMMRSTWQALTDEAFIKMATFETGYVEAYVDSEDGINSIWSGIVGSMVISGNVNGRVSGLGHRSLSITFTPVTAAGQNSYFSQCRIIKTSSLDMGSGTTIV